MRTARIIKISLLLVLACALVAVMMLFINGTINFNLFNLNLNFSGISNYSYKDAANYTSGPLSTTQPVTALDIGWVSGSVTVVKGSGGVKAYEDGEFEEDLRLHWYLDDGVLYIRFCKSGTNVNGLNFINRKNLTVELPASVNLTKISCDTVSAGVTIDRFYADTWDIDSVSGAVKISSGNGKSLYVNSVSGSITVSEGNFGSVKTDTVRGFVNYTGNAKSIESDSVSGKLTYNMSTVPNLRADTVSGGVFLSLPENDGFSVKFDSVSGSFEADDFPIAGRLKRNSVSGTYKSGGSSLDVGTVSGSLKIERAD